LLALNKYSRMISAVLNKVQRIFFFPYNLHNAEYSMARSREVISEGLGVFHYIDKE
jgi:hypothetical protein